MLINGSVLMELIQSNRPTANRLVELDLVRILLANRYTTPPLVLKFSEFLMLGELQNNEVAGFHH